MVTSVLNTLASTPALDALKGVSRWTLVNEHTIDPQIIKESNGMVTEAFTRPKVPIDARHFINYGRLRGAWTNDEQCLVTFDELKTQIPTAANTCFHLQAQTDGFLIIDIEPEAPDHEKARLLSIPEILYAEMSLSGHGYHLLMPLPKNFYDFPTALTKDALKNGPMHWEILLNHWVTFTGKKLSWPAGHKRIANPPTLEEVWEEVAPIAKPSPAVQKIAIEDRPDIPLADKILHLLSQVPYNRTLDDFHQDHSRYEFGVAGNLYTAMKSILVAQIRNNPDLQDAYGVNERAWLLYLAMKQRIDYRPKHDEFRGGYPWLMYQAIQLIAREVTHEVTQEQNNI